MGGFPAFGVGRFRDFVPDGNPCTLQRLSLWYPKGILVVPEGFVLGVGAGDEGAVGMIKHRVGCLLEDMLFGVCTVVPLCFH